MSYADREILRIMAEKNREDEVNKMVNKIRCLMLTIGEDIHDVSKLKEVNEYIRSHIIQWGWKEEA